MFADAKSVSIGSSSNAGPVISLPVAVPIAVPTSGRLGATMAADATMAAGVACGERAERTDLAASYHVAECLAGDHELAGA